MVAPLTERSRCGWTPATTRCSPGRRYRATARSTSPSSAGGYTGLWTAYYLAGLDPTLRIAVVEAEIAGFGASGRNGGWCSALWPTTCPPEVRRALADTVDEVGRRCATEGIAADYVKGGSLRIARTPAQVAQLRTAPYTTWLSAEEASAHVAATGTLGAAYDADCAALHPGRLVRGLARAVERHGVTVYEQTRALRVQPRSVVTDRGRLRADVVVRATEGYTPRLDRRALAPVYSLVIATEPLPASFWERVGWSNRETVSDGRRLIIYAQRTADDRIVFGGRGAPYHFGSAIKASYDRDGRVHTALRASLVDLWPAARDAAITHVWGGPLGVPRDFQPSVRYDRRHRDGLGRWVRR